MLVNGIEVEEEVVAPEPSLRETIEAAVKESAVKDAAGSLEEIPGETVEARAARARDAAGKFTKDPNATVIDQKLITDPKTIPPANAKTTEQLASEAGQQQQSTPQPPRGWSPASKAAFATLPPSVQADIHKREMDVDAGFAKYKGLDRHVTDFKNAGVEPEHAIAAYRQAEQLLVKNFDEGVVGLCHQFQKHPLDLAKYLVENFLPAGKKLNVGGQQPQNGADNQLPANHPVMVELNRISKRLERYESKDQQKEHQAIGNDIDSFLKDPAHIYADNVIDSMVDLIKQGKMTGNIRPLKEVYDAACWLNPEVRQILIDEQIAAKSKGAIAKTKAATTQAKAAAASVTGRPAGNTEGTPKEKTLRETIKEAYDESAGRGV